MADRFYSYTESGICSGAIPSESCLEFLIRENSFLIEN